MRSEPIPTYHFYVDIDNTYQGACSKVSGLSTSHETIESWQASKDGDTQWIKQPGRYKAEDVKITCAFNHDVAGIAKWFKDVNEGGIMENRRHISIHTFPQNNQPSIGWSLINCYPKAVKYPDFDASQNQAAMLELTLAVEKIEFEAHG
jgi:phage tail-like protein